MSEEIKPLKNNVISKIKENKKVRILLVFLLALLLIVFLTIGSTTNKETEVLSDAQTYVYNLENKLETTLSKIKGVGDVNVIIKTESGMETVLAKETIIKETSNGIETIESPILVNGKTVTLKELYPKITGVLIVAEGANSITITQKIQQATTSLLGVDIKNIEILSMN